MSIEVAAWAGFAQRAGLIAASLLLATGCASAKPPVHWASGAGTLIELPRAQWSYRGDSVEIRPLSVDYAEVRVDGDVELFIDRAGRVYDHRKNPFALLEPDGRLVGADEELLGLVGFANAALPSRANAWISLLPNGLVLKHDGGTPAQKGAWVGCGTNVRSIHACMLVSYVLFFQDEGERTNDDMGGPMLAPSFGPTYVR